MAWCTRIGLVEFSLALLSLFCTCSGETPCSELQFRCLTGECVSKDLVCNGHHDCPDKSDEWDCNLPVSCPESYFTCSNGSCIIKAWRCDGANDCGDNSDELNCKLDRISHCQSTEFRCEDGSKCIPITQLRDGRSDCPDGSDEVPKTSCDGFSCTSSECISWRWRCDGSLDCEDGSDELNCTAYKRPTCLESDLKFLCDDGITCLGMDLVCNGVQNCHDGSDEGRQCANSSRVCAHGFCAQGCYPTPEKPVCYCKPGFQLSDGKLCNDVNECRKEGVCSHVCVNTEGAHDCTCFDGYELDPMDKSTCRAKGSEPILLYSTAREIKLINLRSGFSHPVHGNLNHAVGVDYDSVHDKIVWSEVAHQMQAIMTSDLEGRNMHLIISEGILVVEDVALDWVGRNIYLSDSGFLRLLVCSDDGLFCRVLVTGLHQPRSILVYPEEGFLFWTDWGRVPAIERSLMDGSNRKVLVGTDLGWPNGLAIDHPFRRIYWCDAKHKRIESVDLDGNKRKVAVDGVVMHPFALTMFEDTLYWTDWTRRTLESCRKFNGSDHRVLVRELENNEPMGVHVYHPLLQKMGENPCWHSGCNQMCLLTSSTRYTCACAVGYHLGPDGKKCEGKLPKMLVSLGEQLLSFQPAVIGKHAVEAKGKFHLSALAQYTDDTIYYEDLRTNQIMMANLSNGSTRVIVGEHVQTVQSIVIDGISQNIYWLDSGKGTLEVCKLDGINRRMLLTGLQRSSSIVVAPTLGLMYMSIIDMRPRIERLNMDGSDRHILLETDMVSPMSLALDVPRDRLYWVDSSGGKIEYATLDGKQRFTLKRYPGQPSSISISTNLLFWTDTLVPLIYWMDLGNSTSSIHTFPLSRLQDSKLGIIPMHALANPKLASTTVFDGSNECSNHNGGCSHFCLPIPGGKSCMCPSAMLLSENGVTCQDEGSCSPEEFTCSEFPAGKRCIPNSWVCDNVPDCLNGSDEAQCKRECRTTEFTCSDGNCIHLNLRCDHRVDCPDGSDEKNCSLSSCRGLFPCGNGKCIAMIWRCDGDYDCEDKSDEVGCNKTCSSNEFKCNSGHCIPLSWHCDGSPDCRDESDEVDCKPRAKECKIDEFRCRNHRCVDWSAKCDMDDDCGDGSDEENCKHPEPKNTCPPGMYTCVTGQCLLQKSVCNGVFDCSGGEDELRCVLAPKCDGQFLCSNNDTCIPKGWTCDGENDCPDASDEKLPQCHGTVATITHPTMVRCPIGTYTCLSGECVDLNQVCDQKPDCKDSSDEGKFCLSMCAVDNGGCSHFCAPSPSGPMCSCRSGFSLAVDGTTCVDIDECVSSPCSQYCHNVQSSYTCSCASGFILKSDHHGCKAEDGSSYFLVGHSHKVNLMSMDGSTVHIIHHDKGANIQSVDLDYKTGDIYWVDATKRSIFRWCSTKNFTKVVLRDLNFPNSISIDWISRNLFYGDNSALISICTLDFKVCRPLLHTGGDQDLGNLVVDPHRGLLFWSKWTLASSTGKIERAWMNGMHHRSLVTEKIIWPHGLFLDFVMERIYWVDTRLHMVESTDYNGNNRRIIAARGVSFPMALTMLGDELYFGDWGQGSILHCTLPSCNKPIPVAPAVKVLALKLINTNTEYNGSNSCSLRRCSDLCVPIPSGFTCFCPLGEIFIDKSSTKCTSGYSNQTKIDGGSEHRIPCHSKHCLNGGTCLLENGLLSCRCPEEYTGDRCQMSALGSSKNHSWVAGLVVSFLFIGLVCAAAYWYFTRISEQNFRGSFATIPLANPKLASVDEESEGELTLCPTPDLNERETYHCYSNPMFDRQTNANANIEGNKVQFHVSRSVSSFDSAFASQQAASLLDLDRRSSREDFH